MKNCTLNNQIFDGDVKFKFSGLDMRVAHDPTYREVVMILEMLKTQIENGQEIDSIEVKKRLRSL